MPRGYDSVLYIPPFDHRGSFQTKMLDWKGALNVAAMRYEFGWHIEKLAA